MTTGEALLLALAPVLLNADPRKLTPEERVFVVVWELEADVNNGGFHQYYFNSSGNGALSAPSAFRTIGAERMASIVDAANELFPGGPKADWAERQSQLESIPGGDEAFEALDEQFYSYPDDLSRLLSAYVQANRARFRSP